MIDYEQFLQIRYLHDQKGLKASRIADKMGIDPRTAARWVAAKQFTPRQALTRSSKLDPFKNEIIRMLDFHPYTAAQVFNRIRERGFDGGYTIVKDYIRKIRPRKKPTYLTLSFAPGERAQVDWGSYGSVRVGKTIRRLSFFVMVLCYSRMMYVEFTVSQTMEHFLGCHQRAFDFFGGCVQKVMVDNLKSAVLKRIIGKSPVLNPKYLDFANHYGFSIAACNVGKGNEKGRVENAVGYVKKNFLAGLDIPHFDVLHPAARHWMDTVANVRKHGTTHERPVDLLPKEILMPLPANPFDIATVTQVRASSQFRIPLDTDYYSVPAAYAGSQLTLKAYPDRVCIYFENKLIMVDFINSRVRLKTSKRMGGTLEHDWLPMTTELRDALRWWWANRPVKESPYVFICLDTYKFALEYYGKPFKNRRHLMDRLCDKAKVERFGFHAIRHLTAAILYNRGYEVAIIQLILRHKSPSTTEGYLKSLGLEKARDALEDLSRKDGKVLNFPAGEQDVQTGS